MDAQGSKRNITLILAFPIHPLEGNACEAERLYWKPKRVSNRHCHFPYLRDK